MRSEKAQRIEAGERALAVKKRALAALQKRCAVLWGELGAQEQEYVERKLTRAPAAAAFRRYESLRDRYWAMQTRCVELRGMIAAQLPAGDDLP